MIWIINGNDFFSNFEFYGFDTTIHKLGFKNIFWTSPYDSNYIAINIKDLNVSNKETLSQMLSDSKQYVYLPELDIYHYKPKFRFEKSLPEDLNKEFIRSIIEIEIMNQNFKNNLKFKWKYLRKIWNSAEMPLFVDFNNGYLLYIKTLNDSGIGYGKFVTKDMILKKYAS